MYKSIQTEINERNADTLAPLTRLCPNHVYGMLDDGVGNLVFQNADAWAAAYYHANHP